MIRRIVLLVAAGLSLSGVACGEGIDEHKSVVRSAIARTKGLARSFSYSEQTPLTRSAVQGILEDDYRYKARLESAGRPVLERVVLDDALAIRFLDPASVADALGIRAAPGSSGGSVIQALQARRWVLDEVGAPELVAGRRGERRRTGDDVAFDGLTALDYVERAIGEAAGVVRFNRESIEYVADEDTFPVPGDGSGVTRYDLVAADLPRPSRAGALAAQGAPQTSHFRRMAVYVKQGRVIQVREAIRASIRQLDHLAEFYEIEVRRTDTERASVEALTALNALRQGAGEEPIRPRTMTLEVLDLGRARRIELPADAIPGSLRVLSGQGGSDT